MNSILNYTAMKTILKPLFFFALAVFVLQSCSDEDDDVMVSAPVISNFEIGGAHDEHGDEEHDEDHEGDDHDHEGEAVAHKGESMHVGADILAQVRISSITLEIHSDEVQAGAGEVEWDFDQVYTDAKYLVLNPEFHEDIQIPANIPSGEYHVTLTVVDERGNSTNAEGHIDIMDEEEPMS
jgi:hypothetical protein